MPEESVQLKIHGPELQPTLVYLPGLHGDWTVAAPLAAHLDYQVRFVMVTYPRTETWSIRRYGAATGNALQEQGIDHAWVLGESFGSQVAWTFFDAAGPPHPFVPDGLILAGGFVRHPWPAAARACAWLLARTPPSWFSAFPKFYLAYVRLRLPRSSVTDAALKEFINRRTATDLRAMAHRLRVIAQNDPRSIAQQVASPVFHLSGLFDPIVPAPLVRRWLRRHCPGFHDSRTIASADHNVLLTTAQTAARQILIWMRAN